MNLLLNSPIFPAIPRRAYRGSRGLGDAAALAAALAAGNIPTDTVQVTLTTQTGGMISNSPVTCAGDDAAAAIAAALGASVTRQVPCEAAGGAGAYQGCRYPPYPPGSSFPTCPYINGQNAADFLEPGLQQSGITAELGGPTTGGAGQCISGGVVYPCGTTPPGYISPAPNSIQYVSPAPNATTASAPPPSSSVATSTAGASPAAGSSNTTPATGCFALFGDSSCFGPIGSTTALVLGAAIVAAFFMFGGKH
jgi:hypothetical protein